MERDTAREIALAVLGVAVFVGGLLVVGSRYDGQGLSGTGSYALVGVLAVFLVVMTLSGYWLSTRE
jgi:hypothetical protein